MSIKGSARVVSFFLGIFEIFSAFDFLFNAKERVKENVVFPEIWSDLNVVPLFIAYILMLGLLRLNWSLGRNGVVEWTALVMGHIIEMILWWHCAYKSKIIDENESLVEFIPRAIQMGRGVPMLLFGKIQLPDTYICNSKYISLSQFSIPFRCSSFDRSILVNWTFSVR